MKILHILYSGLGGHGNVFFSFVNADTAHELKFEAIFNGKEVIRNDYIKYCEKNNIQWKYVKKSYRIDTGYYIKIISLIKHSNADIIFLHSSSYILPAVIGKLLSKEKKRIIVRETQANNLKTFFEWFWLSLSMMFANQIVFLSEQYKLEIQKKLSIIYKKKKISVIPTGIDLELYQGENNADDHYYTIGMQSRIVKIKDHETLLKAFNILRSRSLDRPVKLQIAGDGENKDELLRVAQQLNITDDVVFTGMLNEIELIRFLKSLDIYVHASFGETMSTAIMQAMASELPIVASDVEGINNMIITDYNGILVTVKQEHALADAIHMLLINKELSKRLANNAYNYARENFSNKRMLEMYKQIFYN